MKQKWSVKLIITDEAGIQDGFMSEKELKDWIETWWPKALGMQIKIASLKAWKKKESKRGFLTITMTDYRKTKND